MAQRWLAATASGLLVLAACSSPAEEDPTAFCDLLREASLATSSVSTVDLDDGDSIDDATNSKCWKKPNGCAPAPPTLRS